MSDTNELSKKKKNQIIILSILYLNKCLYISIYTFRANDEIFLACQLYSMSMSTSVCLSLRRRPLIIYFHRF